MAGSSELLICHGCCNQHSSPVNSEGCNICGMQGLSPISGVSPVHRPGQQCLPSEPGPGRGVQAVRGRPAQRGDNTLCTLTSDQGTKGTWGPSEPSGTFAKAVKLRDIDSYRPA